MGPVCGDTCRRSYEVEGREAPCERCQKEVLPANQEAFRVFGIVQTQVVTAGMGEPVGLDFNAVNFVMELYEVRDRLRVFEKVNAIFREIQERRKA